MIQPQITVGLSGRFSVIFRPDTEEEGRQILRYVDVAPELLVAADLAVHSYQVSDSKSFKAHFGPVVDLLQAAIAKAEGTE